MNVSWAVTPEKIQAVIQRIVGIEQPRKIILFGSAARGEANVNSDADFLIVTRDEVASPRRESVRIRRALCGFSMPMDILVISEKRLKELASQPGLIYREALRTGKVVYEAAA